MIQWFNADMSSQFREDAENGEDMGFRLHGSVWHGILCFFFHLSHYSKHLQGVNIPNIAIIILWKGTRKACPYWQRIGRAGRDPQAKAFAILIVEPKHFDTTRIEQQEKAAARRARLGSAGHDLPESSRKKRKTIELEQVMDDIINASTREYRCYRLPATIYFQNDKTRLLK